MSRARVPESPEVIGQRLRQALTDPQRWSKVKIWPPLSRRVRLRLWFEHHVNGAGIWLCDHGHCDAAVRLWKLCRMW